MSVESPSDIDTAELGPAFAARHDAHDALHDANRALVERDWWDPVYVATRRALERVTVDLARAKWMLGRIDGTYGDFAPPLGASGDLDTVVAMFGEVTGAAGRIQDACRAGRVLDAPLPELVGRAGSEISFAGDVPLVPSICPIVVLQGSNRDMGRQYAQQVIEIFGRWIFAPQAARRLDAAETAQLRIWEAQLRRHMPEVLAFVEGWADGASMSYDQVLAIWTGTRPFATESRPFAYAESDAAGERTNAAYLGGSPPRAGVPDLCSGVCAWGAATADGRLVAGATTDHDCTFQATIVAFPADGHSFVYTPFSVKGSIPMIGRDYLGGHPGMNSRGVAYVHHGGASGGEPRDQWGYGVRRGAATFHALQFADSAAEARDMMLRLPVGDAGVTLGTAGGLWADGERAFCFEARNGCPDDPDPIIREATYDAYGSPHDFLYANNNALSPRSGHLNGAPRTGYEYSLAGGWHTVDPRVIHEAPGPIAIRRLITKTSEGRNRFHYRAMMEGYGRIDLDYLDALYHTSGEIPPGDVREVAERWHAGERWNSSVAHRGNAFTALMAPRADGSGTYRACVGPAARGLATPDPGHGYYYVDETNAFWEITLAASPAEVLADAERRARAHLAHASEALAAFDGCPEAGAELARLMHLAESELAGAGRDSGHRAADAQPAGLSRRLRSATRAQVRAKQVAEAVRPPAGLTLRRHA
ncbi:hypothetical protein [Pseudonocardia acaciae]|uniref:hypothetical protein n=1 Tax=Pseudonocardia acaciae TaxID=551276 RepID=UPI00048B3D19|nr:hypothetical protein [Pseudonocardia acaciae]